MIFTLALLAVISLAQTPKPVTPPTPPTPATSPTPPVDEPTPGVVQQFGSSSFTAGGYILQPVFSPDGKWIATMQGSGTARLFDAATGKGLWSFHAIERDNANIAAMGFLADGNTLVAVSYTGSIFYWNIAKKQWGDVAKPLEGPFPHIDCAAMSGDGKFIALGTSPITICDAQTGNVISHTGSSSARVFSLAFSADNKTLISTGNDGLAYLWDPQTGEQTFSLAIAKPDEFAPVCLSGDGSLLAGFANGEIHLWDAHSGKTAAAPKLDKNAALEGISFSPVGRRLTIVLWDSVLLWDADTDKRSTIGPIAPNSQAIFSPDGKQLLTWTYAQLQLWDVATGKLLAGQAKTTEWVSCVAASANGRWIAIAQPNKPLVLRDALSGRQRKVEAAFSPFNIYAGCLHPQFSSDGRLMLLLDDDSAQVYDLQTLQLKQTIAQAFTAATFSPDGREIVGAMDKQHDGDIGFFPLGSTRPANIIPGHGQLCRALAFTAAGDQLAVATDETLAFWDPATLKPLPGLPTTCPDVTQMKFAPDARFLVTRAGNVLSKWDLRNKNAPPKAYPADPDAADSWPGRVSDFAISPNGKLQANANREGEVLVWDCDTGRLVAALRGHDGDVSSVAFLPDGLRLVTGGTDGTVLIWDLRKLLPMPEPSVTKYPRVWQDELWKQLDTDDTIEGWAAVAALSLDPPHAMELLRQRMSEPQGRTPYRLDHALKLLEFFADDSSVELLKSFAAAPDIIKEGDAGMLKEIERVLARVQLRRAAAAAPVAAALLKLDEEPAPPLPTTQPADHITPCQVGITAHDHDSAGCDTNRISINQGDFADVTMRWDGSDPASGQIVVPLAISHGRYLLDLEDCPGLPSCCVLPAGTGGHRTFVLHPLNRHKPGWRKTLALAVAPSTQKQPAYLAVANKSSLGVEVNNNNLSIEYAGAQPPVFWVDPTGRNNLLELDFDIPVERKPGAAITLLSTSNHITVWGTSKPAEDAVPLITAGQHRYTWTYGSDDPVAGKPLSKVWVVAVAASDRVGDITFTVSTNEPKTESPSPTTQPTTNPTTSP